MPNHTDVHAMFYGEPVQIEKMRLAQRLHFVADEQAVSFAKSDKAQSGELPQSKNFSNTRVPMIPEVKKGPFGLIPSVAGGHYFSLGVATPMPASLHHVTSGGHAEIAQQVLEGKWRALSNYRGWEEVAASKTLEEAKEQMKKSHPGALEQGEARLANVAKYGFADWYGWSLRHWGTKWDAYESYWCEPKHSGRSVVVTMQTAWSPPIPALEDLCTKFDLRCACIAVDEGGGFSFVAEIDQKGHQADYEACGSKKLESIQAGLYKKWRRQVDDSPNANAFKKMQANMAKERLAAWPALASRGEKLGEGAFGSGAPMRGSTEAADAVFTFVGEGSVLSEDQALAALECLRAKGIVSASDATSAGQTVGEMFALSLWTRGVVWALESDQAPGHAEGLVKILRHVALEKNDKEAFALALVRDPSWMPKNASELPPACRLVHFERLDPEERLAGLETLVTEIEEGKKKGHIHPGLQEAIDLIPQIEAVRERAELEPVVGQGAKRGPSSL